MELGPRGEVLFVVETDQPLGRLVFATDGPVPFQLSGAEEGVTIYRQLARPGTYCLQEVTTGNLNVGYTFRVSPPACTQVEPGKRVYGGHLVISGTSFRRVSDLERLARQLRDPEVEVIASPPELAEQPFAPG